MLGDRFQIKDADGNSVVVKKPGQEEKKKQGEKTASSQTHKDTKDKAKATAAGSFDRIVDFIMAGVNLTQRIGRRLLKIARPLARAARFAEPYAKKAFVVLTTRKDKSTGERHFSRKRALLSGAILGVWCLTLPIQGLGLYYYTTLQTLENVYIPDAAVFINQQHVEPGKRSMLAARDEIYTVMGKHVRDDGTVEPIRFDIDYNPFFFFYSDAMRPDLAASKLNSQSPYGVRAKLKTTGIYGRLPRSLRINALKWFYFRSEIVKVVEVVEVEGLPSFVKTDDDAAQWKRKPIRPPEPNPLPSSKEGPPMH